MRVRQGIGLVLLGLLIAGCSAAGGDSRAPTAPTAAPAASASSSAPSAAPPPSAPVSLRIGLNTPAAAVAPAWVAKEEGIFRRYGIDAELVGVPGAERLAAAVFAGEIPMTIIAAPAVLTADLGGADLVLLGSYLNVVRFQFFGRPEIAAVRDLRGKQVAVTGRGGIIRRASDLVLERNGLDPERDVTFIAMGTTTETLQALLAGVIDATMQGPPGSFRAEDEGMRLLADTGDYNYQTIQQGIAARRPWIAEHEALARGVLQALAEGVAFAQQHKERTKQIIGQYTQTDDARTLDRTYDAVVPPWDRTLRAPPEALRGDLDAVAVDVPAARDARPEQFLDTRLVDDLARAGFFERLGQ